MRIKCSMVLIMPLRSTTKVDVVFEDRSQIKPVSAARVNSTTFADSTSLCSCFFV